MIPIYTIAIPVYERIFAFEEAIESAIAVRECSEILVVDDLSSHNEFEQLCIAKNDKRIRYVRNSKNVGLFGNWNRCVQLASGDYISILCSDDIIAADIFTRFNMAYDQSPDIDVFFGSFTIFYKTVAKAKTSRSFKPGVMSGQTLLEDVVENGPGFPVLSVIRKAILLKFPFVAKPHSGNDWLWIYGNAMALKLYADSQPLSYWRRHSDQDAEKSKSITTDCWPLMYELIAGQLKQCDSNKFKKANRRAVGVILSWLLNDKTNRGYWGSRLLGDESKNNPFIHKAREIADNNWVLSGILKTRIFWSYYYNIGRITRKLGIYPL